MLNRARSGFKHVCLLRAKHVTALPVFDQSARDSFACAALDFLISNTSARLSNCYCLFTNCAFPSSRIASHLRISSSCVFLQPRKKLIKMPRDDLSIDFVKRMPQAEPLDPGLILEDWINRVQNLPEEIRFIHEEISEKDRQYNDCVRMIEDRDAKIQKWIKTNGSHEPNPKEDLLRAQIREHYVRADQFSKDKIALTQKLQQVMDKHLRSIDIQIKLLYDRAEPGFNDPDEVPSLLRPSAANQSAPSIRAVNPSANMAGAGAPASGTSLNTGNPVLARLPNHPQIRQAQAQQQQAQLQHHASSAPATPAASMILNRQRESSAGPSTKRGPRMNPGLGNAPTTSSGLARHSSLGPGTPKGGANNGAGGPSRAGSVGPKAGVTKSLGSTRRGTPTGSARKKPPSKSNLSRVKKASNRNSPASTADSDLSEAESASGEEDGPTSRRHTPLEDSKDMDGEDGIMDVGRRGRRRKRKKKMEATTRNNAYAITCHMVTWWLAITIVALMSGSIWSCVKLESEPNGTWVLSHLHGEANWGKEE